MIEGCTLTMVSGLRAKRDHTVGLLGGQVLSKRLSLKRGLRQAERISAADGAVKPSGSVSVMDLDGSAIQPDQYVGVEHGAICGHAPDRTGKKETEG